MRLRTKLIGGAAALATVITPIAVWGSSHREAPFITKNPKVDGTDFYMFNSYDPNRAGSGALGSVTNQYVTILANYLPLQDAYGGPNFFNLDPDAIYEISIDQNGDNQEDLTFQFQFSDTLGGTGSAGITLPIGSTTPMNIAIPYAAVGSTDSLGHPGLGSAGLTTFTSSAAGGEPGRNVFETYTVKKIVGNRRTGTVTNVYHTGTTNGTFAKPVDNIGPNTIQNYATYASSFMYDVDIDGCTPPAAVGGDTHPHPRVFVGQRKEGFAVNLGEIFDSVALLSGSQTASPIGPPDQSSQGVASGGVGAANYNTYNTVKNKNITTIALEIPASCLTQDATHPIIGAWTTASVRQARVINPAPTYGTPSKEGGAWTQVSRLGMPLVNEVVIGLPDKDKFNGSEPKDDATNFAQYVTNPTLPYVLQVVYGAAVPTIKAPNMYPRLDLEEAFLTGVPMVNGNGGSSEMLRLNTQVPATLTGQDFYGAAGCFNAPGATTGTFAALNLTNTDCDPAGFPNGRRPGDDVVDIALRVVMGAFINTTDAPGGGCLHTSTSATGTGNTALGDNAGCFTYTDGAGVSQAVFTNSFPYLNTPVPGSP